MACMHETLDARGTNSAMQAACDLYPGYERSREHERQMAALIARGDQAARNRLVLAHLGLVASIARRFRGRGLAFDDLVGEGNLGLIRAAEAFDPSFGTRFTTYATYWVEEAIRDAPINRTAMIRLPAYMIGVLTKWNRARQFLHHQWGYSPTFQEVANHLGLTEREQQLVEMAQRTLNRKPQPGVDDRDGKKSASEPIDNGPGPVDRVQTEEDREELELRMHSLNEREQKVIACRFGLGGKPPLTLREIGEHMSLTRESISRLERRAIEKLGSMLGFEGTRCSRPRVSV